MATCPECSAELEEPMSYCPFCGCKISERIIIEHKNKEIEDRSAKVSTYD